jgi:hypothetical protein
MIIHESISVSPRFTDLPLGFTAPPSDLDELASGRGRELRHFMNQAEFQSFLRRQVDIPDSLRREYLIS